MSIYHDHILDHYHNPRHHGTCAHPTHHATAHNPSCGDQMTITLTRTGDTITDIAFDGEGCAISQAGASLLTEHIAGQDITQLRAMTDQDMLSLLAVPISPGRMKCALLGLNTAKKALTHTVSKSMVK
jgi:nitrogen fixation NifU-like protein